MVVNRRHRQEIPSEVRPLGERGPPPAFSRETAGPGLRDHPQMSGLGGLRCGVACHQRPRTNGHEYVFSEGAIAFPDPLDRPARTMLTSEGTIGRSTHVIADPMTGRLRCLTPEECERIDGFDSGWTDIGMPERQRYFMMGNALVVPLIEKMGGRLMEIAKGG